MITPDYAGYWICKGTPWKKSKAPKHRLILFWIHGGAYCFGHPLNVAGTILRMAELASEKGIHLDIFAPQYSLAPEKSFPKQFDQVTAAYRSIIVDQGVDPANMVVGGESAGGHLVLSFLHGLEQHGLPKPEGGALLCCPWVDLTNSGASFANDQNRYKDSLTKKGLDQYAKSVIGPQGYTDFAEYIDFSAPLPAGRSWKDILPPRTWLSVGGNEVFLASNKSLVKHVEASGAHITMKVARGRTHAWEVNQDMRDLETYVDLDVNEDVGDLMAGALNIFKGLLIVTEIEQI